MFLSLADVYLDSHELEYCQKLDSGPQCCAGLGDGLGSVGNEGCDMATDLTALLMDVDGHDGAGMV